MTEVAENGASHPREIAANGGTAASRPYAGAGGLNGKKADSPFASSADLTAQPLAGGSPDKAKKPTAAGRQRPLTRKERKASKRALTSGTSYVPMIGVNLRDVGAVTGGPLRAGMLFRSSELLSKEEMKSNQIKTILDLRRMDRPCKQSDGGKVAESTKTIIKYLLLGPSKLVSEKRLLYIHRAHPQPCSLCKLRALRRFDADIQVIHADLIPSTVGLRIFQAMPGKVQVKAICMACTGKGAASVIAPAVANPLLLGYKALYRTLLEDSKRGMALALRPFVDDANFPILVHCIHGKDRTGLIIMLLLMLCNVEPERIVDDYVLSETVLKESRMHDELKMDVYLTSDDVIAATRDTMENTIEYINDKYDGVEGYMHEIGLEQWEIDKIRGNLMLADAQPEKPEPSLKSRFSIQNFLHFPRWGSTTGGQANASRKLLSRRSVPLPPRNSGTSLHRQSSESSTATMPAVTPSQASEPGSEQSAKLLRRASLANSGPAEIRELLRSLRAEHPELGPLSEDAPVDFLRTSTRTGKDSPGTASPLSERLSGAQPTPNPDTEPPAPGAGGSRSETNLNEAKRRKAPASPFD